MAYASLIERLTANSRTNKRTGCREWTGNTNNDGYARYSVRCGASVRKEYAHRAAWMAATGRDIPEGMQLDHICCNRRCIAPGHLQLVTNQQNAALRSERMRRAA